MNPHRIAKDVRIWINPKTKLAVRYKWIDSNVDIRVVYLNYL